MLTALCTCSLQPLRHGEATAALAQQVDEQFSRVFSSTERCDGTPLRREARLSGRPDAEVYTQEGFESPSSSQVNRCSERWAADSVYGPDNPNAPVALSDAHSTWMALLLPDMRRLVDVIALPGSMHSCCSHQRQDANIASRALWPWSASQNDSLAAQLEMGVRALDFSLCYEQDPEHHRCTKSSESHHYNYRRIPRVESKGGKGAAAERKQPRLESAPPPGEIWVSNKLESNYTLRRALAEIVAFLHNNPTEFVVLSFGRDPDRDSTWCYNASKLLWSLLLTCGARLPPHGRDPTSSTIAELRGLVIPAPREPGVMLATGLLSRAHAHEQGAWGVPCGVILPRHLYGTLEVVSTCHSKSAATSARTLQSAFFDAFRSSQAGEPRSMRWLRIGCGGMLRPHRQMRPVTHALAVSLVLEWLLVPNARSLALGIISAEYVTKELVEAIYLQNCRDATQLAAMDYSNNERNESIANFSSAYHPPSPDTQLGNMPSSSRVAHPLCVAEVRAAQARWLEWAKSLPLLASVHDEFVASRPWAELDTHHQAKSAACSSRAPSCTSTQVDLAFTRGATAHSIERYSSGLSSSSASTSAAASRTPSGRSTPSHADARPSSLDLPAASRGEGSQSPSDFSSTASPSAESPVGDSPVPFLRPSSTMSSRHRSNGRASPTDTSSKTSNAQSKIGQGRKMRGSGRPGRSSPTSKAKATAHDGRTPRTEPRRVGRSRAHQSPRDYLATY